MSFSLLLISTLQQNWRKVQSGGKEGEMTQTMYAHVNKLIIKKERKVRET
jgi:hypothetical protein